MASVNWHKPRSCWRVRYLLPLPAGKKKQRAKFRKTKSAAQVLSSKLEALELAAKNRVASDRDIKAWIEEAFISLEEAGALFSYYDESAERQRRFSGAATDIEAIRAAYEEYALEHSKARDPRRKSHINHMSMAGQVLDWLATSHPGLALEERDIKLRLFELQEEGYTTWYRYHWFGKLRLLLDRARELGMVQDNVARHIRPREVRLARPGNRADAYVPTEEEIAALLSVSLEYGALEAPASGGLPTVVRLGLMAGLRKEEMCWLPWAHVDRGKGTLLVGPVKCRLNGRRWSPKTTRPRTIDLSGTLAEWLDREAHRQEQAGLLGQFVLLAGDQKRPQYRGLPLSEGVPSRIFRRMLRENRERLNPALTLRGLRHTYATYLDRQGVPLKDIQGLLGHHSRQTTEIYIHASDPVTTRPSARLPYAG